MATRGSMLTLKDVFLTKKALLVMAPVHLVSELDKKNHGMIPAISHKKNGDWADEPCGFIPLLKTNHITNINTNGCKNAHNNPRYEPKYCFLKSFITSISNRRLLLKICSINR